MIEKKIKINGIRKKRKKNKKLKYKILRELILVIIFLRNITLLMKKEKKILNFKNLSIINLIKKISHNIINNNININKEINKLKNKMKINKK